MKEGSYRRVTLACLDKGELGTIPFAAGRR